MRSPPSPCALAALLASLACAQGCGFNPGGANRGAREPGSGAGGVEISAAARREIAVDPSGKFALYFYEQLQLVDLEKNTPTALDVPTPQRVAFWPSSPGFFGLSTDKKDDQQLYSYDIASKKLAWVAPVQRRDHALKALAGGKRLFVWGSPGNARLVDAATGQTESLVPVEGALVDVDELPSGELLLTEAPRQGERQGPRALLRVIRPDGSGERCRVEVENCADETTVVLGQRAIMAPTFCGKDPVSVVDLSSCKLEKTLAGFGPVAPVQKGQAVVAFIDRDAGEAVPKAIREAPERYHIVVIDAHDLSTRTVALGPFLPRYAPLPSGKFLLIDTSRKQPVQPRLFDVESLISVPVLGPAVPLEAYVLTPDDRHAYLLSNGLYDLRTERRQLDSLPLPYIPEAINITPDGKTLLLLEGSRLHLLDADTLRPRALISP